MPPSSENSPVEVRRSTMPASRKSALEIERVVDHLQHGAVEAEVVEGEQAEHDQPDCASDEYMTTPRKSGARNASSEP